MIIYEIQIQIIIIFQNIINNALLLLFYINLLLIIFYHNFNALLLLQIQIASNVIGFDKIAVINNEN